MSLETSNENEEYNLEDVISLNRFEKQTEKSIRNKLDKNINFDDKEYNVENIDDVKQLLENVSDTIKNKINPNINKFVNMNYNDKRLEELYKNLENISKNKGSYKDILEVASKIELIEKEKENISDDEIEITVNYLKKVTDIFSNFQYMLENRYFGYES